MPSLVATMSTLTRTHNVQAHALCSHQNQTFWRIHSSLSLSCVYFSTRRTFPRVLNFAFKLILTKKYEKIGGGTPLKKNQTIFISGQNFFFQFKNNFRGKNLRGVQQILGQNVGSNKCCDTNNFFLVEGLNFFGVQCFGGVKKNGVHVIWESKDPLRQYFMW